MSACFGVEQQARREDEDEVTPGIAHPPPQGPQSATACGCVVRALPSIPGRWRCSASSGACRGGVVRHRRSKHTSTKRQYTNPWTLVASTTHHPPLSACAQAAPSRTVPSVKLGVARPCATVEDKFDRSNKDKDAPTVEDTHKQGRTRRSQPTESGRSPDPSSSHSQQTRRPRCPPMRNG